jgi:hypothetical protein
MQTCPAQTVPAIAVTTDPDASDGAGAQKTAAMVPICSHDGIWHLNAFE